MNFFKEFLLFIGQFVIAFCLALLISCFIFQPTVVQGSSMEPTLQDGKVILLNKLPHTFNKKYDYGDIVVIDSRINRKRTSIDVFEDSLKYNAISTVIRGASEEIFWIKRVVGKAGDIIEINDGKVYRNGTQLSESYIKEPMKEMPYIKAVVPNDSIYVLGDNRNNSKDSRYIGSIPLSHVLGTKTFQK